MRCARPDWSAGTISNEKRGCTWNMPQVAAATQGWTSIHALSAETGLEIESMLRLFMLGRLRKVGIIKQLPFLYGLRFERVELLRALTGIANPMSLTETSARLQISTRAAKRLGENGHLGMHKSPNKARRVQVFDGAKVAEFHSTYASWNIVRQLAHKPRYSSVAQLRLQGLHPAIESPTHFGANTYYARSDVRRIFGKDSL
jgi:hypothetical protein